MKKIAELWKRDRSLILIGCFVTVIVMVMIRYGIWNKVPEYTTHVGNQDTEQFIYYLTEEHRICQEFQCARDFDFITLSFSDHDQRIEGKTIVTVTEKDSGDTVYYGEISNPEIHYGSFVRIAWDGGGKKDTPYVVDIQEVETGEVTLGIFGYPVEEGDTAAIINGEASEYVVSVGMRSYTNLYHQLVIWVTGVAIVMIWLCLWASQRSNWAEEKLFLCLAVPLGMIYLSFLSVNPVHDGGTHLAKVYHFSNVLLGLDESDTNSRVYLYEDEAELFGSLTGEVYRENELMQQHWEIVVDFGGQSKRDVLIESDEFRGTNASSLWEYFPGAIGMTLGRLFGGSARVNLVFSRILFFITYVLACYLAIKISPYLKTIFAFTAMLPMAVYQATGITYDSVITAVILLLLAFWMKARVESLKWQEWCAVAMLAYILGCCKGSFYVPILILFLLIPYQLMKGKRQKTVWGCVIAGAALVGIMTTTIGAYLPYLEHALPTENVETAEMSGLSDAPERISAEEELVEVVPQTDKVAYGVMYMFREPMDSLQIVFHTVIEKADYYIGSLIGYRMAWSDYLTPWFVVSLYLFLITASGVPVKEKCNGTLKTKERVVCAGVIGVEILAFHLLMFIETVQGSRTIHGVQGRYFISLVPLMVIAVRIAGIQMERKVQKWLYVIFSMTSVLYLFFFLENWMGIAMR